jgi:twitching motility protein PilT
MVNPGILATVAPTPAAEQTGPAPTANIIASMLQAAPKTSDLIFSPGRAPHVELHGQLMQLKIKGVGVLSAEDTARIAADLIDRNTFAVEKLKEEGSCDISYSVARLSRFRVNIFTQRGSCAIVMRVIPSSVPDFKTLHLPEQLDDAAQVRPGIVLVTGPTGSGKSSTLVAFVNKINEEKACHVITIEHPIEFLHAHKHATISSARAVWRHVEFCAGVARRVAAGAEIDSGGRKARQGNHRSGAGSGGNRAHGVFHAAYH